MGIRSELREIRALLAHAQLLEAVRVEVQRLSSHYVVSGGREAGRHPEAVVVVSYDGVEQQVLSRRIRGAIPDINVDELWDGKILVQARSRRGRSRRAG